MSRSPIDQTRLFRETRRSRPTSRVPASCCSSSCAATTAIGASCATRRGGGASRGSSIRMRSSRSRAFHLGRTRTSRPHEMAIDEGKERKVIEHPAVR